METNREPLDALFFYSKNLFSFYNIKTKTNKLETLSIQATPSYSVAENNFYWKFIRNVFYLTAQENILLPLANGIQILHESKGSW